MENKTNPPTFTNKSSGNSGNKTPMVLLALIVTLGVIALILAYLLFFQAKPQLKQSLAEKEYIEEERVKLEGEMTSLIVDYDSLRTENDSMNYKLEIEQEKIKRLLRINASNVQKISLYKKELQTLRKVMRSYIVQIDSLNTRNRELTAENYQVRKQLKQVETNFDALNEQKDKLSSTVALAQKLNAKSILAEGLNKSSKPKDKISKIEKIRTCFTIRENSVAEAGKKMIYLRIVRPDEIVLSSPEAGYFDFGEESLVYSAKRELEYDNQDIDMCIFWDKAEELIPGTYFIQLFSEGYEIGTSSFVLK